MMNYNGCFAMRNGRAGWTCDATIKQPPDDCKGCRFYKTRAQLEEARKAANARLINMGLENLIAEGEARMREYERFNAYYQERKEADEREAQRRVQQV